MSFGGHLFEFDLVRDDPFGVAPDRACAAQAIL